MFCTIERFIEGRWVPAATLTATAADAARGHVGPCLFEYAVPYAGTYYRDTAAQVACGYPVDFEYHREPNWPAFLVDLLPQGAGRRRILGEINVQQDGPAHDWAALLAGATNPPGDLRIAEAAARLEQREHPGFTRAEVISRHEAFIEYAAARGAAVAGSSGAQGEAPKFLLTVDEPGRWHVDGALPDARASQHYLVKFPRGKSETDRQILRNEAFYYEVARWFGVHCGAPIVWDTNVLFVRRFDRAVINGQVERYGLESLYSLAGIPALAATVSHNRLVDALARFSTDPVADLVEYLKRDVLNVALHNTDNHGRNSAVLKRGVEVRLSPLYDFAPMFLDDAGIARVCRWEGDAEHLGMPVWGRVADWLHAAHGVDRAMLRSEFGRWAEKVRQLPEVMAACLVDREIIERLERRIADVADALQAGAP